MSECAAVDMCCISLCVCVWLQLKDEYVECLSYDIQALQQEHITAFIEVIIDIMSRVRKGGTSLHHWLHANR